MSNWFPQVLRSPFYRRVAILLFQRAWGHFDQRGLLLGRVGGLVQAFSVLATTGRRRP